MADKELRERLAGLFSDFNDTPKMQRPLSLVPVPEPEFELQLIGLFSDLDEMGLTEAVIEEGVAEPDILPLPAKAQTLLLQETSSPASFDDAVIKLLKSKDAADRCEAVQSLAEMQNEWAVDPLLYAGLDPDEEVSELALGALFRINHLVTERLLALPHQSMTPLHQGAAIYISYLIGQPFVYIPPGPFLMGSDPAIDPLAGSTEQPQHELTLPGYWISRFPVTAIHFRLFLKESGYHPRDVRKHGQDDYPVVDISWGDALAYCDWLTEYAGLPVILPSEAEWEKAARGTCGQRYPWGDQPPTPDLCNFEGATPVGQYSPQGDSPYGCADMAGNIWEWTRSIYKSYPYDPEDGRESLEADEVRVVRGLTFNNQEQFTRCAFRHSLPPMLHLNTLGFRLAISPAFRDRSTYGII